MYRTKSNKRNNNKNVPLSRNGEMLGNIRRAEKSDGRNVGQVTASECGTGRRAPQHVVRQAEREEHLTACISLCLFLFHSFMRSFFPSLFTTQSLPVTLEPSPPPIFSVMGLLAGLDLRKSSAGSSP